MSTDQKTKTAGKNLPNAQLVNVDLIVETKNTACSKSKIVVPTVVRYHEKLLKVFIKIICA